MLLGQVRVLIAFCSALRQPHTQTRPDRNFLSLKWYPPMRLLRALPTSGLTALHRDMESPSCETSDSGFSAYLGCFPADPASRFFFPHLTLSHPLCFALTLPYPFCHFPPSLPSPPPSLPTSNSHSLPLRRSGDGPLRRMRRGPTAAAEPAEQLLPPLPASHAASAAAPGCGDSMIGVRGAHAALISPEV
jgi:hypothetical protein